MKSAPSNQPLHLNFESAVYRTPGLDMGQNRRADMDGHGTGVIGQAKGGGQGDRFNWRYTIDLPVPVADGPAKTVRVSFDDWIWLQSDTRAFNRAYMKRYGANIGDVSISFEKLR